jgi:hypothetical protein
VQAAGLPKQLTERRKPIELQLVRRRENLPVRGVLGRGHRGDHEHRDVVVVVFGREAKVFLDERQVDRQRRRRSR